MRLSDGMNHAQIPNATASMKKRERSGNQVRPRCLAMATGRGGQCRNGAERSGNSGA